MRISGLDLSLTSTGLVTVTDPWPTFELHRIQPGKRDGHYRLSWVLSEVLDRLSYPDWVLVEGPSYGSPNVQHRLGGLWWMVTHSLWARGIHYDVVAPGTLKVFATGRGNASKDEVLAETIRRYPQADIHGNDQADGMVLAAMGCAYLDRPLAKLPQEHLRALASVHWSQLARQWREVMDGRQGTPAGG